MSSYQAPSFEERRAAAEKAREKALAKLKARPAPSPEVLAERKAAAERKAIAAAERRAAKKAEKEAARLKAIEDKKTAEEAEKQAEIDAKAERDRKYAARKARK